jgi:hypothetical protein
MLEVIMARFVWKAALAGVVTAGAAAGAYAAIMRPRMLRWGTTRDETDREWPGDSFAPDARTVSTRAVTIDAPASVVWRWLLQIGQDRAGFYSYTWLENLARADMPDVRAIVPEFQHRALGDTVWLARPDRYGGRARLVIAHLVEGRALVLVSAHDADRALTEGLAPHGTWAFLLEPIDARRTRLVARSRVGGFDSRWTRAAYLGLGEPSHFVMERRMLLTLKQLSEASAPEPVAARSGQVEAPGAAVTM